jgi:hypothetical protein
MLYVCSATWRAQSSPPQGAGLGLHSTGKVPHGWVGACLFGESGLGLYGVMPRVVLGPHSSVGVHGGAPELSPARGMSGGVVGIGSRGGSEAHPSNGVNLR